MKTISFEVEKKVTLAHIGEYETRVEIMVKRKPEGDQATIKLIPSEYFQDFPWETTLDKYELEMLYQGIGEALKSMDG